TSGSFPARYPVRPSPPKFYSIKIYKYSSMPTTFKTPGVYIQEIPAFPSSAVAVETAVPVFIGYTETAVWAGKSPVNKPTKISSFAEYVEQFGNAFRSKFT